ncbi:hypothetical protein ACIBSW_22845 [Actinoplanes sp. NPDC049668]|uniref:hypothetical protein n=1 Tax=unclassified Actinoplanes TaxID=2626549 RepID=UPI0033A59585
MILAVVFTGIVLGVVADIAQLSVMPTGFSRFLLIAVFLTGLLYLVIQIWHLFFLEKVRELRGEVAAGALTLSEVRSAHQRCLEAIERTSDRERPLFSETLEVTVIIGKDDDADLVVEKRITTPAPLVTNRTMRPIVPTYLERICSKDDIGFTAHREGGEITVIPLREQINALKLWLVFDPAMSVPSEWRVEYRPKGLWQPLRKQGFDHLGWDDRLQTTNGTPSAFTFFSISFHFPAGSSPIVKELHGHGELSPPDKNDDGTWKVVWRDKDPAGRRYDWDIGQALDK